MLQCSTADGQVGIAQRAMLVNLVLKDVRINGANLYAVSFGHAHDFRHAEFAVRKVPEYVYRVSGAAALEAMHLAGIAQLLLGGGTGGGLLELAKTGAGIGEAPGG